MLICITTYLHAYRPTYRPTHMSDSSSSGSGSSSRKKKKVEAVRKLLNTELEIKRKLEEDRDAEQSPRKIMKQDAVIFNSEMREAVLRDELQEAELKLQEASILLLLLLLQQEQLLLQLLRLLLLLLFLLL